jgi:protein-S-isoprenylcysteine O-methyltransferase Ste14
MRNVMLRTTGFVVGVGFIAVLLLVPAGRLDIARFDWYLAVTALLSAIGIARMDPGLLQERIWPGPGKWDPAVALLVIPGYVVHLVVAGLDGGRYHWSDTVPPSLVAIGLAAYVIGNAIVLWGMQANPYFSPKVRLQTDRGQTVISTGPYAYLRHPGYAGANIMLAGSALALGSWIAMIPAALAIAGLVWRTAYEDRFLQANLPGYTAYAERVRYRLLPGVW